MENTQENTTFNYWLNEFNNYCETHNVNEFLSNVTNELESIGWPVERSVIDIKGFKEVLFIASNYRIRLVAIGNKIKNYREELKDRYENIIFFLRTDPNIPGKTKEDKKKYSELSTIKEKNIITRIDKIYTRIIDLIEAYKIQYEATSRVLSIVQSEKDMQ